MLDSGYSILDTRFSMLDVIVKPDPSTWLGMTVKNRQFFLAFNDMAGHHFIGRSGILYIDGKCNFEYFVTIDEAPIIKYICLF